MADANTTSVPQVSQRPFWLPDTQGFLAIAIIFVVALLAFILLSGDVKFDDKVAGAFMTLLGVLTACLKDVYSFFFGSSRGSDRKDDVISAIAAAPTPPPIVAPVPPSIDELAAAQLSADELAYFKTLPDDDAKKRFVAMSAAERTAAIGKG